MKNRRSFGAIRRLPSGRYQASMPHPAGTARINAPQTFTTRIDAEGWLAKELRDISTGDWSPRGKNKCFPVVKFEDYAERHLKVQTSPQGGLLRESTVQQQSGMVRRHFGQFLAKPVSDIKRKDIEEWYASLVLSGKKTTAARAYSLMSAIMARAVREGYHESNPCQLKGASSLSSQKKVAVPTQTQLRQIIQNLPEKYKFQAEFLAATGLRFGEMAALTVGDLTESESGCVWVSVNKSVSHLVGEVRVSRPKSLASIRDLPVSGNVAAKLIELTDGEQRGKLVFPGSGGSHQRGDTFAHIFQKAKNKAGLDDLNITVHSLRHFAGTAVGQAGASLADLKMFLGDASVRSVERYLHSQGRLESLSVIASANYEAH